MVSAGLAGKWGSFVRCCPGKPERCGRTDDFFKLSLGGFKGWAQSDSVQIDQPWSKTAHGQECCKFFNFVRIKAFHGKGLGFWVFGGFVGFCLFVCFLELSNDFFFCFGFGWTFCCTATQHMRFQSQPLLSHRTKTLVPVMSTWLCSLSRPHEHLMISTPAPFLEGACWRRSRCSSLDQKRASLLESCWTQPCPGGGGAGKEQHPKTLSKTFSARNTAHASAGLSWAEEKPWTLSGIRWVVWSTFTGERRLKEQNPRASKPDTVHFQFKVHEIRETAYI